MGTSQSPRAGSGLHGPTLADVGELDLLDMLRPYLAEADRSLLIAPGDDAAAWEAPEGRVVVVTTDTLAQDVHFRDPRDEDAADALGWKLLAVSLSDLAAMGAEPGPAFLALALPEHWPVAHLLALYRGLSACATAHGASRRSCSCTCTRPPWTARSPAPSRGRAWVRSCWTRSSGTFSPGLSRPRAEMAIAARPSS